VKPVDTIIKNYSPRYSEDYSGENVPRRTKTITLSKLVIECELEFEDLFCGKVPKDRKSLVHVVLKRAEEGYLPNHAVANKEQVVEQEMQELPAETPQGVLTFYEDEKGLYVKYFDIIGMLKERVRQLGLSRQMPGIISALEGLNIYDAKEKTWKLYLRRPNGSYIKHDECEMVAQPITTWRGTLVSVAECVKPPVRLHFIIEKKDTVIPPELFIEILKDCNRLGGLRKQFGRFKWVKMVATGI